MIRWILAASAVVALPAVVSAQDVEAGKAVYNKCKACHSTEAGKNMVGPSLAGIVGKKAGEVANFKYSDAHKASGKVWDEATLDTYLKDPKAFIPGNKMVFVGIKDDAERKNLIAYMKTLK